LRTCLAAIERRQALRQRFGLPFAPIVAKPPRKRRVRQARPTPLFAAIGRSPAPVPSNDPSPPEVIPVRSGWKPAWAISGGVLAVALLALLAVLFLPEDVVSRALHRNKSVETIGVPVGVPDALPADAVVQNSAGLPASSGQRANAVVTPNVGQTTSVAAASVAPPAPEQSVEPSTKVANKIPVTAPLPQAPPPSPAEIAQSDGHRDDAGSAPATQPARETNVRSTSPPAVASTGSSASSVNSTAQVAAQADLAAPTATPATVAANNSASEPAPPSESPDQDTTSPSNEGDRHNENRGNADEETVGPSSRSQKPSTSSGTNAKSRARKGPVVAQRKQRPARTHAPRALPAGPDYGPSTPGTIRARVAGITPAGNVILTLPSGEQAIVSPQDAEQYSGTKMPHRRPRRVIIERRTIVVRPQPPYQPFIPPDA
jgi:hypothetical protein